MSDESEEGSDPRTPLPLIPMDEDAPEIHDTPPTRHFISSHTSTTTKAGPLTTSEVPLTTSGDHMKDPDPAKSDVVPTEPPPPPPKKAWRRVEFAGAVVKVYGGRFAWAAVGLGICVALAYAWVRWAPR